MRSTKMSLLDIAYLRKIIFVFFLQILEANIFFYLFTFKK